MIWTIKENEKTFCPGLSFDNLPTALPKKLVVSKDSKGISLTADNIVGRIVCLNGDEIFIEPKYSGFNVGKMLDFILHGKGSVNVQSLDFDIVKHLAKEFAFSLIEIAKKQKLFSRQSVFIESDSISGQVDWVITKKNLQSGRKKIYQRSYRDNFDIPENALLSLAARKVLNYLDKNGVEYAISKKWAVSSFSCLRGRGLKEINSMVNDRNFSGAHSYYCFAIRCARLILGLSEEDSLDSFVINCPELFERFIRKAFEIAGGGMSFSVSKGFLEKSYLFNTCDAEIIPDIVVYNGFDVKKILDVKYKKPSNDDLYQVLWYAAFANLKVVYILSPDVEDMKEITAFNGIKVVFVRIEDDDVEKLLSKAELLMRS